LSTGRYGDAKRRLTLDPFVVIPFRGDVHRDFVPVIGLYVWL